MKKHITLGEIDLLQHSAKRRGCKVNKGQERGFDGGELHSLSGQSGELFVGLEGAIAVGKLIVPGTHSTDFRPYRIKGKLLNANGDLLSEGLVCVPTAGIRWILVAGDGGK
jgi:hypothetical protein